MLGILLLELLIFLYQQFIIQELRCRKFIEKPNFKSRGMQGLNNTRDFIIILNKFVFLLIRFTKITKISMVIGFLILFYRSKSAEKMMNHISYPFQSDIYECDQKI